MPLQTSSRVLIGRQSVHDRRLSAVGYELLFSALDDQAGDGTTDNVVRDALNVGWTRLIGDKQLFCSADVELLAGAAPLNLLPPGSVVEVGPDGLGDEAVLSACRRLRAQGFTVAVTGLRPDAGAETLLELAAIAKIDPHAIGPDETATLVQRCHQLDVEVLARNVETVHELDDLLDVGVDFFQGYALQQPRWEVGREVSVNDIAALGRASGTLGTLLDFDALEDVLRTEPALSYQVMQLASLGRIGENRRRISSVRDALVLAGSWRVQNWIALLVARQSGAAVDEEITTALARASACESLAATKLDRWSGRLGFTAGMVSSFERLLQIPREHLLEKLPLSDELREAAFGEDTPLGQIVRDVADHQDGRRQPRHLSGISGPELDAASAAAFAWALEATSALQ
ncbi:MAG TPA: EAL domain-containing protein [Jatrophihabitans sp.]|nr:EAL domain-containing protein [Jatrophihabitans sp.]